MADVFISYSRRDWEQVNAWVERLRAAGVSVWIDKGGIEGGTHWEQAIVDRIEGCQAFLVMLSPSSVASSHVVREVSLASARNKPLLPLVLQPTLLPGTLEYHLAGVQQIDLRPDDTEQSFQAILRALARFGISPVRPEPSPEAKHNLPIQLTSFIGREQEIAAVKDLLASHSLVTLTGPGGCGKTRLGLQVARDVVEEYADGVWLVRLEALGGYTHERDETGVSELVPQAVAAALGVREEPGRALTDTLSESLRVKSLLLVLDNCEHLVAACAQLAETLLQSCRTVRILATSRQGLGIAGEWNHRVPSLSAPDLQPRSPAADLPVKLLEYDSVRLFGERARFSQPEFRITPQNALAVAQVCQRLDGIPLAIELAAAALRALPLQTISERLDDRFRLLTGGSRTALPRQQTLRALMDWSYDLLPAPEQTLLRRLSVFAGGWALEAAEAVCADDRIEEGHVVGLLTALVEKSLVVYNEQSQERYRLLETVRQYARDRLQDAGEAKKVRGQHRDWLVALAEEAASGLMGADQGRWLARLEQEHDNLRAALEWSVANREAEAGLRLGGALWRFWERRGYLTEGRRRLAQLLALEGALARTEARAKALNGAGNLARDQGDYEAARAFCQESVAIYRDVHKQEGVASSLNGLGVVAAVEVNYDEARALWEESLAIYQKLDDKWGTAAVLNNLGNVAREQERYEEARTFYEKSLKTYRELDDKREIAIALNNLGNVERALGERVPARGHYEEARALYEELKDTRGIAGTLNNIASVAEDDEKLEEAEELYKKSLKFYHELEDKGHIAVLLGNLGNVCRKQDQRERAAQLFGAAEALRKAISAPRPPNTQADRERDVLAVRTVLGEEAFAVAWEAGKAMSLAEMIRYALEEA